jgi:branched-chain amino acid transport system ATP-binding protein
MFPRLKERTKQSGGSLSGGEQQMLAIARGLMMDPELLMLDEPSLGLAPIVVEELFERIIQIREAGKTILLIEQNASMALSVADRGYVIETGNVKMEGSGKDLLNNPEVKSVYLGG